MDTTLKYEKGSIIVFSCGEYSDFRMAGFLVAVKDCDLPALAQEFVAQDRAAVKARGGRRWDHAYASAFPSWLVANGYAMPVDASEVHLGDGYDWESEFGVPKMSDDLEP